MYRSSQSPQGKNADRPPVREHLRFESPSFPAPEPGGDQKPDKISGPDAWTRNKIQARLPDPAKIDLSAIRHFNQWAETYASAEGVREPSPLPLALAASRSDALRELIKSDPAAAWEHMLPDEVRQQLPPELQPYLETSIRQSGNWNVYAACFWEAHDGGTSAAGLPRSQEWPSVFQEAVFGEQHFNAFPVGLLTGEPSQNNIMLHGFAIDQTAVFERIPDGRQKEGPVLPSDLSFQAARLQSPGSSGNGEEEFFLAAPESSVTGSPDSLPLTQRADGELMGWQSLGYRSLIYMRIAFANDPDQVVQSENAAYADLRIVNDHLLESSYGRMQILPTVTPVLVLPQPQSHYASAGTGALAADARAAAASLGYTPAQFGHRVYRYNGSPGTFGGFANIGVLPGDIWLRQSSPGILVHEIGHNYAFLHSNGWVTDSKAAIGPSSSLEYDHRYCVMGDLYDLSRAQFNAYQKSRIGWLRDTEYINSQVSGRHRIHAMDDPTLDPDKRYAIRIPTPNRGNYWVEYRNNYTDTPMRNGLLLQAQGNGWGPTPVNPQRIDVTYWSANDKDDSTIPVGWTFSDHEQGVHITPINRAGDLSWIDVQVHHEQDFTENNPPTAIFSASTTTPAVGQTVTFTLSNLSDPDGDEMKQFWYFDNQNYHQFSSSNFTSRDYSWDSPGVYNVIAVVTDMKGGTCFRSIPVTVGSPSTFTISGQILDHADNGVAGVPVDNGLGFNQANYRATLTDEDGNYTLGRLPAGTYTVRARKNYDVFGLRGFTNPVTVGPSAIDIGFRARALKVTTSGTPSESGATGHFIISRVKSPSNFISDISFRISMSGDAEEGVDYQLSPAPTNGLYVMPAASDSFILTLTPLNDGEIEGPEDATLSLGMVNDLSVINSTDTKATMLIEDDETSLPRVRAIPQHRQLNENGGTAEVLFIRYGDLSSAITVNLGTDAGPGLATYGVDYSFNTGTASIVIPAGERNATLLITGLDDTETEGEEVIQFRINTGNGYIRDRDPVNIRIDLVDDDIPTVSVSVLDNNTGEGNNGLGAVRFTRSPSGPAPLNIQYGVRGSALHGTDYTQLSGRVTIPANESTADVIIEGLPDALIEGSESAILRASVSGGSAYFLDALGLEATVSVNDKPILTLTGPAEPFSELAPTAGQFTIHRVGPTDAVEVTLESTGVAEGGLDFSFPSSVSLPANAASVTFMVSPLPDTVAEGEELLSITIIPKTEYGVDDPASASQIIKDLPVDDWKFSTFGADANNPAVSGDTADPDEDGLANLYEFATLTDPKIFSTADLQPDGDSNQFSIEFTRRKNAGVTVQCLWSDSPDAASAWSTVGITEQVLEDTPEFTRVRASLPVTNEVLFLKIQVTRDP